VIAETVGVALAHQQAQWALGERIKELTSLWHRSGGQPSRLVARTTPAGDCQRSSPGGNIRYHRGENHPGREGFRTSGFGESPFLLRADISKRSSVAALTLYYTTVMPESDEGPFLKKSEV